MLAYDILLRKKRTVASLTSDEYTTHPPNTAPYQTRKGLFVHNTDRYIVWVPRSGKTRVRDVRRDDPATLGQQIEELRFADIEDEYKNEMSKKKKKTEDGDASVPAPAAPTPASTAARAPPAGGRA